MVRIVRGKIVNGTKSQDTQARTRTPVLLTVYSKAVQSINQSIKTHFYSAICRERIRGG